jgi:hypothetical protein
MLKFEFKDLINGIENLPKELLNYDSVLYRIFDKELNKNYIGTAKYGMPNRLYDGYYGHVNLYRSDNKLRCRGMYHRMQLNINNFQLFIEDSTNPENYDVILEKETDLINQYDSVLFGYNVSLDGKPGWKEGTICVNDGIFDLYIYQEDVERFCQNGFKLGSCKHDFLKGTIWINNGNISKMIHPEELDKFKKLGFTEGNLIIPNKGKIWINNGKISKLVDRDLLGTKEFKDFKFLGRIEKPRKKRGHYKSEKKTLVNNGTKEIRIKNSELEKFLLDNPSYKRGRVKKCRKP